MRLGRSQIAIILAAAIIGASGGIAFLVIATTKHPPSSHSPDATAEPVVATQPELAVPRIEPATCWFAIPAGRAARCASLVVGERHDDPRSRPLHLRFVVFEGEGATHATDPVIYISGGPGDPAQIDAGTISRWWSWTSRADWLRQRDVVVFDQRGVGISEPTMTCPEIAKAGYRIFPTPLPEEAETTLWADAARQCHDRLAASGIDLERYNTTEIVEDLRLLIEQLGYRSWNLFAVSYGTRVALDFLRDHPGGTRSVILDSVYPPDVQSYVDGPQNSQRAFHELFKECADDAGCNSAFPNLAQSFERVLRRTIDAPLELTLPDPRTGAPVLVRLDEAKLVETLFYGLYDWRSTQQMPSIIAALDRGDTKPFAPLAATAFAAYASDKESHGLFLSVECHDEFPFNSREDVLRAAERAPLLKSFALTTVPLMACPAWPVGSASAPDRRPAASDLPILVFAGELDPAVSPEWARLAIAHLPHAALMRFPGIGHGVVASHACADALIARFLADPNKAPYDGCLLAVGSALFSHAAANP
jgi:pimeloyl-ACP methyl ester carboxylesterase